MTSGSRTLGGRVAVVTGASGGIGAAIADGLSDAGAEVLRPGRAELDVTAAEQVADWVQSLSRLDIWVNCAGVQPIVSLPAMTPQEWDDVLSTNLRGVHLCTQAAAAAMTGGGAILNVASTEGHVPAAGHGHYSVSKAGVLAYTRAAAAEYGARGVRVNSVSPGLIDRPELIEDWPDGVQRWLAAAPLHRLGTAADVAAAVLFLVSDEAGWITGSDLVVDGGMLAGPRW